MLCFVVTHAVAQADETKPEGTKPAEATTAAQSSAPADNTPRIDIALLLDTSNSMDGLINQARTQLWQIVNEFEGVRRGDVRPVVRVALYEYGNQSLAAESGYIRQVMPLTTNLDEISEKLFALTTNGGEEFCGQVIQRAVEQLEWSDAPGSMYAIYIAGNEPFTQGPVDYKAACQAAAAKNITVSTIHCGSPEEGAQGMWAEGAKLADGQYLVIDQNKVEPQIEAPQDKELAELNAELNKTYCAYGGEADRATAVARQQAQDSNAAQAAPAAAASRAATKAGANYRNASWDLVDAVCESQVELDKLPKEQLPEELRELSTDELKQHVEKLRAQRVEIQSKIKALAAARSQYIAAERAKLAESGGNSLEAAVRGSIRHQAVESGFEFVEE
jgi:hypothetical protein